MNRKEATDAAQFVPGDVRQVDEGVTQGRAVRVGGLCKSGEGGPGCGHGNHVAGDRGGGSSLLHTCKLLRRIE